MQPDGSMDTLAGSWLMTGVVALALLAVLGLGVALLPRALATRTCTFYCPWAGRRVVLRQALDETWGTSRLVSCSALDEGESGWCGARCLREGGPPDLAETEPATVGGPSAGGTG
jgi:hypothetical protein